MVKLVRHRPNNLKMILTMFSSAALLCVACSASAADAGFFPHQEKNPGTTTSGIVGTGKKDFSEVTPSGIVGTGKKDFSEVTPSGIVGTGKKDFSEVTPSGIVGTGVMSVNEQDPYSRFQIWAQQFNTTGLTLILYGPVEGLNEATITVLGQEISLAEFQTQPKVNIGETVAVFGAPGESLADANTVLAINESHVEGSSAVYLSGHVTEAQQLDGSFMVEGAAVQIGEAGVDPSAYKIKPNDFVTIVGVKIEGTILADVVK